MIDDALAASLFAVFLEMRPTDGKDQRAQWLWVPPALHEYGAPATESESRGRFLKRRMMYKGHKAKWSTITKEHWAEAATKLKLEIDQYASTGWEPLLPVTIRLEADDYRRVWAEGKAETPYKALRHVEKVTLERGYRLTDS